LVAYLGSRTRLLGVRGHTTRKWLKRNEISATAIGCPSLYAYPLNVARIEGPKQVKRVMVAGHLHQGEMEKRTPRALGIVEAFRGVACSYVFQDELAKYKLPAARPGLYDEATGRLDPIVVASYIGSLLGVRPPFTTYYSFNDVGAWRQA